MKHFFLLCLFFIGLYAQEKVHYTKFIDSQLQLMYKMSDKNITDEKIKEIVSIQEESYNHALDSLMINKKEFIKEPKLFEKEMFSLKKIMFINKRAGNKNAYLRDEIKLKSYKLVHTQNLMIQKMLLALDLKSITLFEAALNDIVTENQIAVNKIFKKDYSYILDMPTSSYAAQRVQKNAKELYALREINVDMINNIYKLEKKMYRLNKFTNYHLISFVISINSFDFVVDANHVLKSYGLNVVELIFIFLLSFLIYILRKLTEFILQRYILTVDIFSNYSKEIMKKLYRPLSNLVLLINANMVIYVYNDFSSIELITRIFNIMYGMFFTYIIYKILNTIAALKVSTFNRTNSVKNEMINVGIKIINFVILILGLLIALHFAGVNLTAVLSGLGIGGFAVAFAAKDTISNFFGTLSILFSNVFSQGDWIIVGDNEGVVVEIGLRVTTLRTFDNALIAIPNGTFATTDVKNWNRRTLGRRIKMSIGVKYDSKSQDIKNAIAEIRTMLDKHPGIATENTQYTYNELYGAKLISKDDYQGIKKTLLVYFDEFGPSSMNILVYCFSKTVNWQEWLEVKEDVMHQIMLIMEKNSLEFAFPSLSIYNEK